MKFTALCMAAILVFGTALTASSDKAAAGHRGRNVAIGVAAGLTTLAIIAASKRAHADEDYEEHHHHHRSYGRCQRLLERCDDGSRWACEKYETSGCTE